MDDGVIRRLRRRLDRAVFSNSLEKVESLLTGVSKSVVNAAATLDDGSSYLHVACTSGYADIAVCLINRGVSLNGLNSELNTPMHCAVKRLESHRSSKSWHAMSTVILSMLWTDPSVYDYENSYGMSPRHMLQPVVYQRTHKDSGRHDSGMRRFLDELQEAIRKPNEPFAETEWQDKVLHSLWEDMDDLDGSEWRFFEDGYQFEALDDYMTRLGEAMERRQYAKYHPTKPDSQAGKEPPPKRSKLGPLKPEVTARAPSPKRLAIDHDIQFLRLLQRAKNKEADLFEHDIPWPCAGTAREMASVLVSDVDPEKLRTHVLRLLRRWHPDKFSQHVSAALAESDRERVLKRVTALSQALMALLPQS